MRAASAALRIFVLLAACAASTLPGGGARAQADAWALLKQGGYAAFMRHSDAPGGVGDPAGFRLEDCATQRNLSEEGRAQARRTGVAFERNGISFDRVLTSPWCRCRETAELATGRRAEDMEALSNLVGRQEHRASQVAALKAYLGKLEPGARTLLVTHGIVIAALLGINPAQGEMVIVRAGDGEPAVAARLRVD